MPPKKAIKLSGASPVDVYTAAIASTVRSATSRPAVKLRGAEGERGSLSQSTRRARGG
jgi:hypothetical protein